MSRQHEQVVPSEIARGSESTGRIDELAKRFAALTLRLELAEAITLNHRRDQETGALIWEGDDSSRPIEYVTENGFSITRPWEAGRAPTPANRRYRLLVSEPLGKEHQVTVEISNRLLAETELHTSGRIQPSSSFWICCAERRLAEYLWEHDAFPDANEMIVERLDPEEVILARRWRRSETD